MLLSLFFRAHILDFLWNMIGYVWWFLAFLLPSSPVCFPLSGCFSPKCPFSDRGWLCLSCLFLPLNSWTSPTVCERGGLMGFPAGSRTYFWHLQPRALQLACRARFHSSMWTAMADRPARPLPGSGTLHGGPSWLDRARSIDWCSVQNSPVYWTPVFA